MTKFEVGKVYKAGLFMKCTKRTAKMVTFERYHHYGRYNERFDGTICLKIRNGGNFEECWTKSGRIIEAINIVA